MSNSEIQAWISAGANTVEDDFDSDSSSDALNSWAGTESDWSTLMELSRRSLLTSKTKDRVDFLNNKLLVLVTRGDLDLQNALEIFRLLTLTYPRYVDAPSRTAVVSVLRALAQRDESTGEPERKISGILERIIKWIGKESAHVCASGTRSSTAISNHFVLLSWTCALYDTCIDLSLSFTSGPLWKSLVGPFSSLLDSLKEIHAKPSVHKGALVQTRRVLRKHYSTIPNLVHTLLEISKTASNPAAVAPLIGVAFDVAFRLKTSEAQTAGSKYVTELKPDILTFYTTVILMSRTALRDHIPDALHDFVQNSVDNADLNDTFLPAIEKALMRSPEVSLNVSSIFFAAYPKEISTETFRRLLTSTLNCAKSTNPLVRDGAVRLFRALMTGRPISLEIHVLAASEVLALPKASKTTSPDHRSTLYTIMHHIAPGPTVSSLLISSFPSLLAKETNDAAISALRAPFATHLVSVLSEEIPLPADATAIIAKELTSSKLATRRAFFDVVGNCFWTLSQNIPEASKAWPKAASHFATALLPPFESNLKATAGSPLNAGLGPIEGYIAVSTLLNSSSPLPSSRASILQTLALTASKPSFLLWEKVYAKLTSGDDERWLLRALESVFPLVQEDLKKSEQLRLQFGLAFLHLTLKSEHSSTRRDGLEKYRALNLRAPRIAHQTLREALTSLLNRVPQTSSDGQQQPMSFEKVPSILLASSSFDDSVSASVREDLVAELLIIAHHPDVAPRSRQCWIEICQKAQVDPRRLVIKKLDRLLGLVLENSDSLSRSHGFIAAANAAATTLAFVAPDHVVPRLIEQVKVDLDASKISAIGEMELCVYKTPEGVPFVDVLAKKKDIVLEKGKDRDIEKWEAELRKSLAAKKAAASTTLSKQDRALVDAQLRLEAGIRKQVASVKRDLDRGLALVGDLVAAKVDEFQQYVWPIATLLLEGVLRNGAVLIGSAAVETYLHIASSCSPRLGPIGPFIGVATLRGSDVGPLSSEYQDEPLADLVVRVLYRLRSLSEQSPFDPATFAYASPLLLQVLTIGGLGALEEDDALEQITLVLDIIQFHAQELSNTAFPRLSTLRSLVLAISQHPQLSKEASSALVDIGEAIHLSVSPEETRLLINGTLAQESNVRHACLQAIRPFDLTELDWSPELWIACHDDDEQNARLALLVWEDNGLDVPSSFIQDLLPFLDHGNSYVRRSSAAAISEAVKHFPQLIGPLLSALEDFYREKAKVLAPEFDSYGMLIEQSLDRLDPWLARNAVADTFEHLAEDFTENEVVPFFDFLIRDEALGDRNAEVRRGILNAGTTVIDKHGKSRLPQLISMFESHLGQQAPTSETADYIREAVVILFGRLARHLNPTDPRIPLIVNRLIDALKTPSEVVQSAVADCLAPLVKSMKNNAAPLVSQLLEDLTHAPKYAERRGAAYGLAGAIQGRGISGLREFKVIASLKAAMDDKKRFESRQGALFALETMSAILGRLFEPYIIELLPLLLAAFGDQIADVREATQDASKVIMANMSGYGVKLILPSLLTGLDEKQWRTKKGSIELLGTMAFCAPKQLSVSLPTVIPRLTSVLTDSHAQVRVAANKSLKQFGEVISNPEIQSLVPVLLKALVDPDRTPVALVALLKKSFVHYIDSPSLALVIPILERGLKERGADTKRKAAQIVGNMASLTDSKDFVPYLPRLIPLVHVVLVDPVPEARATAAKALGTLVERLGEVNFPDLVPGLLLTLKTDTSGVDRQGAAQGLSEVLSGLGMERMEGLLPDIITSASSPRPYVREGFMSLLVFLPATFGHRFAPHLARIVPPILSGLADPEEFVRAASMKAGRMIIGNYSSKAIDLLLPELERGMFDSSWRIRHSSITLVGELLYKVSGISGKAEMDEDDAEVDAVIAESSRKALADVLGKDRRDRILAALYLIRQDAVSQVRQASIHIWKALVNNTPRTVREILGSLIDQIVRLLANPGLDQRETAARTMGELCRKLGEKILGEIVPILKTGAGSPDPRIREGVCLALSEVLENTSETQREGHEDDIIYAVRLCLVDEAANVRMAAAQAFDVLQETVGNKAIDQTIPTLLEALRHPGAGSGTALQALREIMTVRASTVFPVLIPTLIAAPITVFNAQALASLVTVAGTALSKRLTVILAALVGGLESNPTPEVGEAIDEAVTALVSSIDDNEGLHTLMMLLIGWSKHDSPKRRVNAANIFAVFCENTEEDFSIYRADWIRQLVSLLDDRDSSVVEASWHALDEFVKSIDKDEMEVLVVTLKRTIESTGSPGRNVPGFGLPKGIAPLLPIIFAGLTTGSNEQREQAALAIADIVERTDETAIRPYTTQLTGPLIRVITQATTYPPAVKSAILVALTTMLQRIPMFVKPFFPQLQRTFVKSSTDASLSVRTKAGTALTVLMKSQPRVDPLITELVGSVRAADDAIAGSLASALAGIITSAGSNVGQGSKDALIELIDEAFDEAHEDTYNVGLGELFAALASDVELVKSTLQSQVVSNLPPHPLASQILVHTVASSPQLYYSLNCVAAMIRKVVISTGVDRPAIARPAREAREVLRSEPPWVDDDSVQAMF